jgi:hypothetical protein
MLLFALQFIVPFLLLTVIALVLPTSKKLNNGTYGNSSGTIDILLSNLYNISGKCEFSGTSLRKTENSS